MGMDLVLVSTRDHQCVCSEFTLTMVQAGMTASTTRSLDASPAYSPRSHQYVVVVMLVHDSTVSELPAQAWNNINLTRLAEKIKSPLVLSVHPLHTCSTSRLTLS